MSGSGGRRALALSDHDPMAIRRCDRHLAHAPGLVGRRLTNNGATLLDLIVERIDVVHLQIGEIAVLADLLRQHAILVVADHDPHIAARHDLPIVAVARLGAEPEHILEIAHAVGEIGNRENEGVVAQRITFHATLLSEHMRGQQKWALAVTRLITRYIDLNPASKCGWIEARSWRAREFDCEHSKKWLLHTARCRRADRLQMRATSTRLEKILDIAP